MKVVPFAAVVAASFAVSFADAEMVTLIPTRDATLYESADGSLANGAGQYFFAGKSYQNTARRGLLHFDVASALPAGCEITAARITLNAWQGTIGTYAVSMHRALAAWTTGASDAPGNEGAGTGALAGDATWLFASGDGAGGGVAWSHAGGDFVAQSSASLVIGSSGLYTWSDPTLVDDVRLFAIDASQNFGWFVLGDESTAGTARRFDSVDSQELGGIVPTLQIEFTTVPAPGALATLAIAGLGARRRRR